MSVSTPTFAGLPQYTDSSSIFMVPFAVSHRPSTNMAAKVPFLPRVSLSRNDSPSLLPLHNNNSRYSSLRNQPSEYDLDDLSPREDDSVMPSDFHDPSTAAKSSHNRKPTGALNRRPSNSSSVDSSSKTRSDHYNHGNDRVLFSGPPPPIAVSRYLYRDEEQRGYEDESNDDDGIAASWLPGTARRAISSVIWDRSDARAGQDRGEIPVSYDRNSVWRALARRERAIVKEVQRFLQVQEDNLAGTAGLAGEEERGSSAFGRYDDSTGGSDGGGSATPTGTGTLSMTSSRHPGRSVSLLEPVTRAGPGGEIIPVRQPRAKKLGIGGARKGIARSMAQLADLKTEEDASLHAALSTRKQALAKLRKLATRRVGITDELHALETDEEEPLKQEIEELDSEHRGVCTEIRDLEERLAGLKSRRRYLEGRMDDVKNRREAGLSGYKNALKEVEDSVKGFLSRPPVKPLDVEALAENGQGGEQPPSSPGGVEFMHLRPERRTIDMAREWWEAEVAILEKRKAEVDTERAALEDGGAVWGEVVNLVLDFEADLRKQMTTKSTTDTDIEVKGKGKGKEREPTAEDTLKLQYGKINDVVAALEQRLGAAEARGWNLLIAAIGAELEAFREAAAVIREMLAAAGVEVDEGESLLLPPRQGAEFFGREDSGTTGSHNSFHTVNGGSVLDENKLIGLPGTEEVAESDNEVPSDLLATHEEEDEHSGDGHGLDGASVDREDSGNEVPPEFLVETVDTSL